MIAQFCHFKLMGRHGLVQFFDGDVLKSQAAFQLSQSRFDRCILHHSPRLSVVRHNGPAAAKFS
ncbi:Uncharacterised protein [Enterobacter cloacae]|nr:Uncharacterised protein [Enterobacter cloacae]